MAKLHTLTVPDMLWINLQLTGAPQAYNYATLEEGTFYQYKTGQNHDFAKQSARLLVGFAKLSPFAAGNPATAFVGCLAFLEMNGNTLELSDGEADQWLEAVWFDPAQAPVLIAEKMRSYHTHDKFGVPDCHGIVEGIIARYTGTLEQLSNSTAAA